jgi:hypothetical protein
MFGLKDVPAACRRVEEVPKVSADRIVEPSEA